jgi:hypothetical protein
MPALTDEPVELRDRMRALAAADPGRARSRLPREIAAITAERLEAEMTHAHGALFDLDDICIGYRRELWLWLCGERTWDQCASGLLGRLSRRVTGSRG